MSNRSFVLEAALNDYLLDVSLREAPLLRALRQETAGLPMAQMQIAPEQGQFMAWLARLGGFRRCIEVGVFTGYSSLALALALPDEGYLLACDVSEEWTAIARRYWSRAGVDSKIELQLQPAVQTLQERLDAGEAESYDFAFIDADKQAYADYYELCLQLLRPGGVIAVDNTLWSGRVADPADSEPSTRALRAFNRKLTDDQRIDLSLLPLADGLTLCRKRG